VEGKKMKEGKPDTEWKREGKRRAESRRDVLLAAADGDAKKREVEVKKVSRAEPPAAVGPDAKTERGQKQ